MVHQRVTFLVCFLLLAGCVSTSPVSEPVVDLLYQPEFLEHAKDIDEIRIEELTLSRRKDVSRFLRLCRNARWAPYLATMPGKIETVRFLSDGIVVYRLCYANGWLLDTTGEGVVKFATIDADDGDWIVDHVDTPLMLLRNSL